MKRGLIALGIALGLLVATAAPSQAVPFFGATVVNGSGYLVRVQMHGGARYTLPAGENSTRWGSDTDEFMVERDWRCVETTWSDYKMKPGRWFKIKNLTQVNVYAYTKKRCGNSPWISTGFQTA